MQLYFFVILGVTTVGNAQVSPPPADIPVIPVVDPTAEPTCTVITVQGCECDTSWTYAGETFTECGNPNNEVADWCKLKPTCSAVPSGSVEASDAIPAPAPTTGLFSIFQIPDTPAPAVPQEAFDYGFCAPGGCVSPSCFADLTDALDISTFVALAEATNVIGLIAENTVLAPTNAALDPLVASLGLNISNLTPEQSQVVFELLQLHVISGFTLTIADAKNLFGRPEGIPTLAEGVTLEVNTDGSVFSVTKVDEAGLVQEETDTTVIGEVGFDVFCNIAVLVVDSVLQVA